MCGGEPSPGWADPDVYCDDEHRLLAERRITSLFAGAEAERRYRAETGQDDDRAVDDAANRDIASAFHLAVFIATHPNPDIGQARVVRGGVISRQQVNRILAESSGDLVPSPPPGESA